MSRRQTQSAPVRLPRSKSDAVRHASARDAVAMRAESLQGTRSRRESAMLIPEDKPLTQQQKLFVRAWASGESIATALVRAGYTGGGSGTGYRMSIMPNIRKAYDIEKAKYEEAAQMTRKKVMDMLQESYDCAKMMAEPASMVSAAREIGKMCGYYEPVTRKVDITLNGNVVHQRLNAMSDAELLELLTAPTEAEAEAEEGE